MNIKPKDRRAPGETEAFAAYDYRWVFRRMSCQPPAVALLPGPPVVDGEIAAVAAKAKRVARPASWNFASPPNITRDPRHPSFTRVKRGSAVASSESKITELLDASYDYYALVNSGVDAADPELRRLLLTEVDAAKKITVQKGMVIDAPFTRVGPDAPMARADLPRWYRRRLDQIASVYARVSEETTTMRFAPAPADTNAGFPTMAPASLEGKLVGALLVSGTDVVRSRRLMEMLCEGVGISRTAAGCYGFGGRQGPLYKTQALRAYDRTFAKWLHFADWAGCKSRWRTVQMAMYGLLLSVDRLFRWLKCGQAATRGLWHPGDPSPKLPAGWVVYPMDLSGYDTTVSLAMKEEAHDALLAVRPDLADDLRMWMYTETRPVALPDVNLAYDMMSILEETSGIKSGNKVTSVMGTVYNLAAGLEALSRLGYDADAWPNQTGFELLVYGDDVLLTVPTPADEALSEGMAATYAELGLVLTLSGGDDFLAKHITPGYPGRPSAARLLQQRLFNEHEDVGPLAVERAMIGFIASTPGSERLPPYIASAAWDVLRRAEWIMERRDLYGATSIYDASHRMVSNYGSEIAIALLKMQRAGEMSSLAAEAEHSASAAATLELARKYLGADFSADASPEAYLLDRLARGILSSDLSDVARVRLATEGFYAVTQGDQDRLPVWMATITNLL